MINWYLTPVEKIGIYRGPLGCAWRFGAGISQWQNFDMGHTAGLMIVATPERLKHAQAMPLPDWDQRGRANLTAYLRNYGLQEAWVTQAETQRAGLHRLLGMALSWQAQMDDPTCLTTPDPALWLGKEILFTFGYLRPLDLALYAQNQAHSAPIPHLRVKAFTPRLSWLEMLKMGFNPLWGALPANDTFTAANGTALTTYSANWTLNSGDFAINTNAVHPNSSANECGAHWNADAFSNDQYAQVTMKAETGSNASGAATRCHASAGTYYGWYNDLSNAYCFKMVTGTWTQIGANQTSWAVNDTGYIENSSTAILTKQNSTTKVNTTDASIASGSGGISGYSNSTSSRVDDWTSGNLSSGVSIPVIQQHRRTQGSL